MGEHRKEKIIDSRFQNIVLRGEKSVAKTTEFIAGFPPYVRGYQAMGYLQKPVEYQSISLQKSDIFSVSETENIFQNVHDWIYNDVENQSVMIHSVSELHLISPHLKNLKRLFILFEEEKNSLELFSIDFSDELLKKIHFLIFFDADVYSNMEKVRKSRIFWSDIMQKNGISYQIPVACCVNSVVEQLYALSVQADLVLYDVNNPEINDLTNQLCIHNSGILKTIDPFWK